MDNLIKEALQSHSIWLIDPSLGKRLSLAGVDLSWCDLQGCNLSYADLEGCNLSGANLTGARLNDCNLSNVVIDECTILPDCINTDYYPSALIYGNTLDYKGVRLSPYQWLRLSDQELRNLGKDVYKNYNYILNIISNL